MNDRLLCRVEHTALGGDSIGYITEGGEASFGFIGGTGERAGGGLCSGSSAKRLFGQENWGDYAAEVTVTPQSAPNCGLLVRATEPGAPNFMTQLPTSNDAATGTDWVKGYFIGLSENGVVLGKQSYGYTELAHATGQFRPGRSYCLRVECEGARIRVLVDGILYIIDYTDPEPFMQGMVGIRSHDCKALYEDLTVTGLGREARDEQGQGSKG